MEGDPQYASYIAGAEPGRRSRLAASPDARRVAELRPTDTTPTSCRISLPLAARAALWVADLMRRGRPSRRLDASVVRGQAFSLDRVTLRAGLAALEGRRADAIAGYREALRGWRQLGCAFDEAHGHPRPGHRAGTDRTARWPRRQRAIEAARETLTRLGALPLLARLEAARTDPAPARPDRRVDVATAGSSEVRA